MSRSKFISLSASLAVCGVVGFANAEGQKDMSLQMARGTKVAVKRVAGINRNMELTTPWYNVADSSISTTPTGFTGQYDCFDGNSSGFPEDESSCAYGSLRWYFGSTYTNPFATNDMTLEAGSASTNNGTQHAWWWGGGTCNIAVFHAEDFDDTCTGPDSGGTFSGVVYSFGVVSAGGYYYYTPIDLTPYGLNMSNPTDGKGANIHLLGALVGSTFFLASNSQVMLWGNNAGAPLAGEQGPVQWDDDNLTDGSHGAPTECYTYSFGVCPDPLGASYASYGNVTTDCFSMTVSNIVAGQPATFTVTGGPSGNRQYSCAYSFRTGSETFTGQSGYCANLTIDLPANPTTQLAWQVNDADGSFVKTIPIPSNAPVGRTIYFQAAARSTCPNPCSSGRSQKVIN